MLELYVESHSLVVVLVQASFAGEPVQMEVVDLDEVLAPLLFALYISPQIPA